MNTLAGWFVAYLFRWLPHSTATGLRAVGKPDENSPVIATTNFSLTVKRVLRALEGQNLWLLVVPAKGINVWCAARGDMLTHHRVIDAVKVSQLADKVKHRTIILPALAAPGIDAKTVREETGFEVKFGPVYAEDIPEYLERGMKKTRAMRRFRFDLRHRLDMLLSMNFPMYLPVAVVAAIFMLHNLLVVSVIFWTVAAYLYLFINSIPGRTGWKQSLFTASFIVVVWAGLDWYFLGNPFEHAGWYSAASGFIIMIGFDLAGIASGRRSDAIMIITRMGMKRSAHYDESVLGTIHLDDKKCTGCRTCWGICPIGVFGSLNSNKKMTFQDRSACFTCRACVKQCPASALSLKVDKIG